MRLHPDRNPDDANAASRFADFQAACKVFESGKRARNLTIPVMSKKSMTCRRVSEVWLCFDR